MCGEWVDNSPLGKIYPHISISLTKTYNHPDSWLLSLGTWQTLNSFSSSFQQHIHLLFPFPIPFPFVIVMMTRVGTVRCGCGVPLVMPETPKAVPQGSRLACVFDFMIRLIGALTHHHIPETWQLFSKVSFSRTQKSRPMFPNLSQMRPLSDFYLSHHLAP